MEEEERTDQMVSTEATRHRHPIAHN